MVSVQKTSTKYFEASVDENCPHCEGSLVQLIIKEEDGSESYSVWYQCHDCAEESDTFNVDMDSLHDDSAEAAAVHTVNNNPWTI